MAPEVIKQTGHSFPADVWSVGCVLVEMLTGKPPWSHFTSQISALFHIASSKAPPPLPPGISPSAVDFLLLTFKRNPRERPAAAYLLGHALVRDERDLTPIPAPAPALTLTPTPTRTPALTLTLTLTLILIARGTPRSHRPQDGGVAA